MWGVFKGYAVSLLYKIFYAWLMNFGLTLELVAHFFLFQYLYVSICIYVSICLYEHKDLEIHIKYRNKKWVTNSKDSPKLQS